MSKAEATCPPEEMDSEDPLFIIYTSGTSQQSKGVVHTQAGYLLYAAVTHQVNKRKLATTCCATLIDLPNFATNIICSKDTAKVDCMQEGYESRSALYTSQSVHSMYPVCGNLFEAREFTFTHFLTRNEMNSNHYVK